jgi:hypothetical protein
MTSCDWFWMTWTSHSDTRECNNNSRREPLVVEGGALHHGHACNSVALQFSDLPLSSQTE